jgi:threonine dehydratase
LFAEGVAVKRIGDETFRLCQEYLDDIVTVDSDAICAAMKDLFEDVRAVAEPSGALALAGMKNISLSIIFAASVWRTCCPGQRQLPRPALRFRTLRAGNSAKRCWR